MPEKRTERKVSKDVTNCVLEGSRAVSGREGSIHRDRYEWRCIVLFRYQHPPPRIIGMVLLLLLVLYLGNYLVWHPRHCHAFRRRLVGFGSMCWSSAQGNGIAQLLPGFDHVVIVVDSIDRCALFWWWIPTWALIFLRMDRWRMQLRVIVKVHVPPTHEGTWR